MSRRLAMTVLLAIATLFPVLMTSPANAQIIASDNFNRADETPFAVGGNWGRVIAGNYDGVSSLVGNQVTSVSKEGIYYWQGAGTFDPTRQFARQRVVQKDGELGLVLLGGSNHSIMVAWGPPGVGNTVYIYWYENGADRGQLATGPSTLNNGDIIEASLEGGVIYAKVNGVVVKSVANTTTLTAGTPGFITYLDTNLPGQVSILDDWEAGTPASYTIMGTITESAVGLSGVLVTASGGFSGSATTNASGVYTVSGVPTNSTSIVLTPTLGGHTMSPLTRTVLGPIVANVTGEDFTSTQNTGATLTVLATHGSVTKDPDQTTYTLGTQVTLTPVPDGGYAFSSWSGNVPVGQETANPLVVTMDQDRTITAHFFAPGAAASDDFNRANESPLVVGGDWQKVLAGGFVNLTNNQVAGASNDAVYFWQGAGSFDNTRQYARSRVVQAGGQVGLVLLGANNQGIVVAWGGGRLYIYWYLNGSHHGELANLAATLQDGDEIEAVLDSGKIYAKRNGVVVTSVNNTTSLTSGKPGFETYLTGASFDDWEAGIPPAYSISGTITENAAGLSGVLVTASGGFSANTTTDIDGAYTIGGVPAGVGSVVVTPTLFGHTMSPLSRTVAGPLTGDVTGQDFTGTVNSGATLTVNATHGSVTRDPDQPSYSFGTVVSLTPVADAGYSFAAWSGDVPVGHETDNPLLLTMDQDRTVTAHFVSAGVVAVDFFDRADETPLFVGGNWQKVLISGSANLTSNHVAGASNDAVYSWQGAGTFDIARQYARARVVSPGGQVGLVLLGTTNQAIVVAWNAGTLYIYRYVGGSNPGNLTTASSTLQAGDIIEAVLDAGTISAKINGATVASVANTTGFLSGRPGFETYQTGGALDDWEAGTPAGLTHTIGGTILENSTALAGVLVTASGGYSGSATTNATGTYAIVGVPDGATSIVLTPTLSGHTMSPPTRTVSGPVTGNVTGQDFTSTPNGTVTLTINATHGTVTRDPDLPSYTFGTDVTLTPVPDAGYRFAGWSGDVPIANQSDDPLHVLMNQDRTINAYFVALDVVAWDFFDRANEFPLTVGGNWQRVLASGTANLISNHVAGVSADALYRWQGAGAFDTAKQFSRLKVVSASGQVGLVLLGGDNRALVVAWNAGTLYIYRYVGGTNPGNLTTVSSTLQNGDVIEALLENGIVYAKINGVVVASVANNTGLPWGQPGFESYQSGAVFDDWQAGPPPCSAEVCDGFDNDCDGSTDEEDPGGGGACVTGLPGVCSAGTLHCVGGAVICQENTPSTSETCNGLDDDCDGTVDDGTTLCSDGDACTTDSCQGGTCVGTPVVCNDNNPCTDDSCNPATGCVYTDNTAACDDGNACTTGDVCGSGVCAGATPVICNDSNVCTDDTCVPATGCVYTNNAVACDDGSACTTGDVCGGGVCAGATPVVCNDNNVCTDDSCVPGTGCVYTDNTAACDDGNACTSGDVCGGGTCAGATPVICNDNNVCTDDTCVPATGCIYTNNTATCDDGNACTTGDVCGSGVCAGATPVICNDSNVCTDDTCVPATGCVYTNNAVACDDGSACTTGDVCGGGVCAGATPVICNDNNVCTDDACVPGTGCVYTNNTAACDDGNACTSGDVCGGGVCAGATPVVCNDNNVCTDDSCNPATGCVYTNNTAACDDGNACTSGDICGGGVCAGATPVICNDNNVCTDDACVPATGCVYTNNTAACDDGNACTSGDVCGDGACAGATPVICNDNNVCTTDSCIPATGCVFVNNTASCDDGNVCTSGDTCQAGSCVGIPVPPPAEVQDFVIDRRQPTKLIWTPIAGALYDIASSTLASLAVEGAAGATCLANDRGTATYNDNRPDPAPGGGYYYIIRAQSICGVGSYGHQTSGLERLPTAACP